MKELITKNYGYKLKHIAEILSLTSKTMTVYMNDNKKFSIGQLELIEKKTNIPFTELSLACYNS